VNEGPTLKRFTMAAMGRGTPIKKRTSHVEIRVGADAVASKPVPAPKAETKAKTKAVNPAAKPRGEAKAKAEKPAKKPRRKEK